MPTLDPLGPERFHLMLEAARMGYAVRDTHIAEPSQMRVPAAALNDKAFAKTLAAKLDRAKRVPLPAAPTPGSDTVYLTVVDRDRRAVSLINSLYSAFGTAICTEKTGIMFNNRGSGFVLDPGHPNTLGPSKRPMHTIIPALAMRDGRCDMTLRRHGRALPADGPRADGAQPVRLRHGHPERDRRAARVLRGRSDRGRARHAGRDRRGPEGARPSRS